MKRMRRIPVSTKMFMSGLFLLTATHAYESRMENRGYSSVPYARDEEDYQEEGRMSSRGYNSDPYEVNVDGRDNVFSRDDDCNPDVNGLFGSSEGVAQPLGFYYQVETLPLVDGGEQGNEEIIGKVETSISKTLLPSLFLEQCALTERSRKPNQWLSRRLAEMLGITTLPRDEVLQGVECEGELSNELNECYVVDGNMTLYSGRAVDGPFLDAIRSLIRDAMTSGDYNDLDPRLVNVSYRESLDTTDPEGVDTSSTVGGGDDKVLPAYAWALIGIGVVGLLVALIAGLSRRRKYNNGDAETGSFPDQTSAESVV